MEALEARQVLSSYQFLPDVAGLDPIACWGDPAKAPVVSADVFTTPPSASSPPQVTQSSGLAVLRTYRLAVAATGEFTQVLGSYDPSVTPANAAFSQIVSAVNRVNEIYTRDLGIRLELVSGMESIFTDPLTDPYRNRPVNDPSDMQYRSNLLSDNQSYLDASWSQPYDVGFLFAECVGGMAGLGVAGKTGLKARGVIGFSTFAGLPAGFMHEVGHMFDARHTFNYPDPWSQRNASTAFEPGSGSSIMAYAGGDDALQADSDPCFFHSASIAEITNYVDNTIPTIGARTTTTNHTPTVAAGPTTYVVPARTPFVLTAAGSDLDGDALLYTWEERDLGAAEKLQDLLPDNGRNPLFRAFAPTADPSRSFPQLNDVYLDQNKPIFGEKLPTASRVAMNFRVSVRDGRGGVSSADTHVQVVDTTAAFRVTSPNTALSWVGGTRQRVTWDVAGTDANGINTASVAIKLSTDGGRDYPITLAANVPNTGSATIVVPTNISTATARLRIEAVGNIFFDVSDANIRINALAPDRIVTEHFDHVFDPQLLTTEVAAKLGPNWETYDTGSGRIQISPYFVGSEQLHYQYLKMDGDPSVTTPSLTETTLHVNLAGYTDARLTFDQIEINGADADDPMPSFFSGRDNSDGVALSTDGANWFRLLSLTGADSTGSFQTHTFNLSAIAAGLGLALNSDTLIKFQRYGSTTDTGAFGFDDIEVTATAPVTTLETVTIDDGTAQRSRVRSIDLDFSGRVQVLSAADALTLSGRTGDIDVIPSAPISLPGGRTRITLTFDLGLLVGGSLPDGDYVLLINGAWFADDFGAGVDAQGSAMEGSTRTVRFHRFFGDSNGDRLVDGRDYLAFRTAYVSGDAGLPAYAIFDANGDGRFTTEDLQAFTTNFRKRRLT